MAQAFIHCSGDHTGHNYIELRRVMYRHKRYKELPDGSMMLHYADLKEAKMDMQEAYKVFSEHPDKYTYNYWRKDYFTVNYHEVSPKDCDTEVFLYFFQFKRKRNEQTGVNRTGGIPTGIGRPKRIYQ